MEPKKAGHLIKRSSFGTSKKILVPPAVTTKSKQKTVSKRELRSQSPKVRKKETYDKEVQLKFETMMKGDLKSLPEMPRSIVRIFLSSTFSDMRYERNMILREVFPFLKQYCASLDLDFQLLDMRWGVTDDSINDHSGEKLCLKEVETCQRVSLGPNFVALTGDRYGYRPIPVEIDVSRFEDLLTTVTTDSSGDRELLLTWYRRDDNAVPPVYVLQPIRSQFQFYGDPAPGCEDKRQAARISWGKTLQSLQRILQSASDVLLKSGKMTKKEHQLYRQSVTESEIQKGIVEAKSPKSKALYYHREFFNLTNETLADQSALKCTDTIMMDGKVCIDEGAKMMREALETEVRSILPESSRKYYKLPWVPFSDKIEPECVLLGRHRKYLSSLYEDFITGVLCLIDNAVDRREIRIKTANYYSSYLEILHHLQFCNQKCETFCGQTETLQLIKSLILDNNIRQPIFVYGISGSGKTSIMAKVMQNLKKWFEGKEYVGVIQFLGTSPSSLNIYDVLFSICGQLADAAEIIMEPVAYRNMKSLVEYMPRFLRQVVSKLKIPVVVLLDSIDQLSSMHDAYLLKWMPTNLPTKVHFILSTLTDKHGILENARNIFKTESFYVAVPPLSEKTGKEIIRTSLCDKKRDLTSEQKDHLLMMFKNVQSPLFLKLLLDEAVTWTSYLPVDQIVLKSSVRAAIDLFFANLEQKYGQQLVSSALGLITVGINGISEIEMEDALSCDDKVLDEVYQYHDPPVKGIVRIPPVLWARIRHEIGDYLVERLTHGKDTLTWYHRQFVEAASDRYTMVRGGIYLHKVMSEIFLKEDGVKRDIYLSKRKMTVTDADRQVTQQLLTVRNKRKLDSLPYHLIRSYDLIENEALKKYCLCNFNFLKTKISAFSIQAIVANIQEACQLKEDNELALLEKHLTTTSTDLRSPIKLGTYLLAHLKPQNEQTHLIELLDQTKNFLFSQDSPVLIPVYPCLSPRSHELGEFSFALDACMGIVAQNAEHVLLQTSISSQQQISQDSFVLLNGATEEMQEIELEDIQIRHQPYVDKSGTYIIYLSCSCIVHHNVVSGIENKTELKSLHKDSDSDNTYLCFPHNGAYAVVCQKQGMLFFLEVPTLKIVSKLDFTTSGVVLHSPICTNGQRKETIVFVGKEDGGAIGEIYCCNDDPSNKPVILQIGASREHGHATLAQQEDILIITSLENLTEIVTITINGMSVVNRIQLPENVQYMMGADELCQAVVLSDQGNVYCVDCHEGEILHQITLVSPVKSLDMLWDRTEAIMGDNQGQITMESLKESSTKGSFQAHVGTVKSIYILGDQLITLGSNRELKVWSISELKKKFQESVPSNVASNGKNTEPSLLDQKNILSIAAVNSSEIMTFDRERTVKVWSADSAKFSKQFKIDIIPDQVDVLSETVSAVYDSCNDRLVLFDMKTRKPIEKLDDVKAFTVNKDKTYVYAVTEKQGLLHINKIDVKSVKIKQTFTLMKSFPFLHLEATVTPTERFIVLKVKISQKEFDEIVPTWNKQGKFPPQPHRHKFIAIDLNQANGALIPCYRMLSKIPFLGELVAPYMGNSVMIATRTVIVVWDIPTGKCDEKLSKLNRIRMMCRNYWVGDNCDGKCTCIAYSSNQKYVVIGSEDGYVFIYDFEAGLPVKRRCPSTRHSSQVSIVQVSPDCQWVMSACSNHFLKLWEITEGQEVFSMRAEATVRAIRFTADSRHVAVLTRKQNARLLLFRLFSPE
ncbi:hypothetical protein ScPMuIL_004492 [Solemya velum]